MLWCPLFDAPQAVDLLVASLAPTLSGVRHPQEQARTAEGWDQSHAQRLREHGEDPHLTGSEDGGFTHRSTCGSFAGPVQKHAAHLDRQ